MNKLVILFIVLILGTGITAGIIYFNDPDIDDAIEEFEAGDYDDALKIIKKIFPMAKYDQQERMYYYRIRSVNALADYLEKKYNDELVEAALEKKGTPDYDEALKYLNKKLKSCNEELETDLRVHSSRKASRIISGGNFYNKFVVRYRGSRYIEDLDYENLKRIIKSDPDRIIPSSVNYYMKYPGSSYTAHLVKYVFASLEKGAKIPGDSREGLKRLLVAYGKQYSTSPEMNRLYDIKGDGINLRSSPGVNTGRVGTASAGDLAIQLSKSMDTTQVGDHRDYWYHITTLKGKKGWIFGKFLTRLDMSRFKESSGEVSWNFQDTFSVWIDSHTPEKWNHTSGASPASISFKKENNSSTVHLAVSEKENSGLYNRYPSTRAFSIESEGRHVKGSFTLIAYVTDNGSTFRIDLMEEKVNVNERSIPIHTADWHTYRLESADGKFATLYIDNEMVSGRIPALKEKNFRNRGLYCLVSSTGKASEGELKIIKIR